jgi:hypothetical protein
VPDTATLLLSAGIAATTTLLIEYAAKPRLEARKDRIVEKYRDANETYRELATLRARLDDVRFSLMFPIQIPVDTLRGLSDDSSSFLLRLQRRSAFYPSAVYGLLLFALVNVRSFAYAASLPLKALEEGNPRQTEFLKETIRQINRLSDSFTLPADYIRTPRWRWIRRRRLYRLIETELNKIREVGSG